MLNTARPYRLRGYHPLRHRFPTDFDLVSGFLLCATPAEATTTLPQPPLHNACRLSHEVGLASSDFARHYSRNHGCFLFLRVLRCFTSPCSLHTPYFIQVQVTRHNSCWVSPFGHPRINARLPTPQGISQAPTSFIGSRCQGIHHVPLTTCPQQTTNTHNNIPTNNPEESSTTMQKLLCQQLNHGTNHNREHTQTIITKQTLLYARVHYEEIKQPETNQPPHPPRNVPV